MTPTCPKCASIALVRDDYGVGDDREEAVRCLACGWRIARPRPEAPKPDENQKLGSEHYMKHTMVPCCRVGCTNKARRGTQRGLCRSCSTTLYMWEKTRRTRPAPFVQTADGRWVINPERQGRAAA